MITGTIRSAVRLQVWENEWQQKKNNRNRNKPEKEMTSEERMIASFQEQVDKERESNSHADLYNKLKSGGKLTAQEISYLEEHDPEALRKYREDQAEKAAYEREIRNCKTKDEVERVKMNKLGNMVAQAKAITNDPYIPLGKKVELMNQMNNKLCMIREAHQKFVESTLYQDMPTDREVQGEGTDELDATENMREIAQGSEEVGDGWTESEETVDIRGEDTFEKITYELNRFLMSFGAGRGKFDVSV